MAQLADRDPAALRMADSVWTLDEPFAQQSRNELNIFLKEHVNGVKSVLEIGSCFGRTLEAMAGWVAPGCVFRVIDLGVLPEESSYSGFSVQPSLMKMGQHLVTKGFDCLIAFGNSHDQKMVDWARQWAPYDVVMIDAGHTQEDVIQDVNNYRGMGKVVALHDIANPELGVMPVWKRLTAGLEDRKDYREIVCPMGIGVIIGGA